MLDKIMAAFMPKPPEPVEVPQEPEPKDLPKEPEGETKNPKVLDAALVTEWETKLAQFVYDPELAAELAPSFVRLLGSDGFDKVLELLETKEKQIEAIGSSYKQQSSPDQKQEEKVVKPQTATDILRSRNQ